MKKSLNKRILIVIGILVITSVACSCGALNSITNMLPEDFQDMAPEEIATAIAEQIPEELAEEAGEMLNEAVEEATGGDEAMGPAVEDQVFNDLSSSMEGLESYRTRIFFSVDGQDANGTPVQETVLLIQEAIKPEEAFHMLIESEVVTAGTKERYEFFSFGDTFYMLDPEDSMGMGMECLVMTSEGMGDDFSEFEMANPDELFDEVEGGKLVKRGEMVNGIKTDHYRLKNVSMAEMTVVTEQGDIWIAQNGGFIVKFVGDGQGDAVMFSSADNISGKMHWEYDLLDVNKVGNIPLPESCQQAEEQGMGEMPVPDNATEVSQFGPMLTYNSPDTPDIVAEYFRLEMEALGYTLSEDTSFAGMFMYTFTKDGENVSVIITEGNPSGTSVIVTTAEY